MEGHPFVNPDKVYQREERVEIQPQPPGPTSLNLAFMQVSPRRVARGWFRGILRYVDLASLSLDPTFHDQGKE